MNNLNIKSAIAAVSTVAIGITLTIFIISALPVVMIIVALLILFMIWKIIFTESKETEESTNKEEKREPTRNHKRAEPEWCSKKD